MIHSLLFKYCGSTREGHCFFLDVEVHNGSQDKFCKSDNDIDEENFQNDLNNLLHDNEGIENIQQEIEEILDVWDATELEKLCTELSVLSDTNVYLYQTNVFVWKINLEKYNLKKIYVYICSYLLYLDTFEAEIWR